MLTRRAIVEFFALGAAGGAGVSSAATATSGTDNDASDSEKSSATSVAVNETPSLIGKEALRESDRLLAEAQARLEKMMVGLMAANEAPPEAFERLDLEPPSGHAAAKPVKEGAR